MIEELRQKAEKYANDKADKGNYDYAVGDNVFFGKSALEKAYIAGATENGVVWHDLRKNPEDLPFKMGIGSEVVLISYDGEVTDFAYYNFELKRWEHDGDAFYICDPPPVAWCEISKFEEVDK